MGTSSRRRGMAPSGPVDETEATIVDLSDGQRLLARLVERPGSVELLIPGDDDDHHFGTYPTRRAALAAFDDMRARR